MFGCIALGAFLALVAFKFLHHRRMCAAGGRGWGHHHHHHHHRRGGRGGGRGMMWAALARLDLTPAQEKVVRAEVEKVRDKARALKEEAAASRGDMARSIRGESFEEGALADMFVRHDDRMHDLRGEVAGALGRIHAALDPEQRERLASLLEEGPRGLWREMRRGPYR
ncbi:MAG TPA: periplasmic heavy metal sensor [Kofleriaceae bacterium]|nr:periplasmic heavy metal sensor [Kofleriaceae bacterium]